MSSLDSLIRLHRWLLDEKRQKLQELERLHDRMVQDLRAIELTLEREARAIGDDPELALGYPTFAASALDRRKKIEASIDELNKGLEIARDEVNEAFRELKKYETAKAHQDRQTERRRQKREQAEADERGLQLYRRRAAGR